MSLLVAGWHVSDEYSGNENFDTELAVDGVDG